jgi:hypothetical protein
MAKSEYEIENAYYRRVIALLFKRHKEVMKVIADLKEEIKNLKKVGKK